MRRVYAGSAGDATHRFNLAMLKVTTCQEIKDESDVTPPLEGGVDQSLDFLCDYYENECDQLA